MKSWLLWIIFILAIVIGIIMLFAPFTGWPALVVLMCLFIGGGAYARLFDKSEDK